jgi:hypothetical protein
MKDGRFALVLSVAVTAAIATAGLLGMSPSAASAVGVGTVAPTYPNSIAAIGHSDTNGSGVKGPRTNWPHSSWMTGDSPAVQSLYSRILACNPAIRVNRFNLAINGADVASMLLQAKKAVGLKPTPELVVVQGIDNDIACTLSVTSRSRRRSPACSRPSPPDCRTAASSSSASSAAPRLSRMR